MTYYIRPALPSDLTAINRVIHSAVLNWPVEHRLKRLAATTLQYSQQDMDELTLHVAVIRDEIVGVTAWVEDTAASHKKSGLLHGLYVLPLVQRQSIGRSLMHAAFAAAQQSGLVAMSIKAQRVSCGYFERQGFASVATTDQEYPYQYWASLDKALPAEPTSRAA